MLKISTSAFLFFLISSCDSFASTNRISSQIVNLGQVHKISMVVGMVTIIEIPGNVTGVRCGNPAAVLYVVPESPKNEVSLVLKEALPRPTNLIIKSGNRMFVFDIIPSKSVHQDAVKVVGAYGGPVLEGAKTEIVATSSDKGGE